MKEKVSYKNLRIDLKDKKIVSTIAPSSAVIHVVINRILNGEYVVKNRSKTHRFYNVRVNNKTHETLERLAKTNNTSIQDIIYKALEDLNLLE